MYIKLYDSIYEIKNNVNNLMHVIIPKDGSYFLIQVLPVVESYVHLTSLRLII